MQPGKVILKTFSVKKVYIKTANQFRDSITVKLQLLKDAGELQEYDAILAGNIPEGLTD